MTGASTLSPRIVLDPARMRTNLPAMVYRRQSCGLSSTAMHCRGWRIRLVVTPPSNYSIGQ